MPDGFEFHNIYYQQFMKKTLSTYKNHIIWIILTLGLLVTSLLVVQDYGAVGQGCVGFGSAEEAGFNCASVTAADPLKQIGLSSSIAGFIFFLLITGLFLYKHFVGSLPESVKKIRKIIIYLGLGYLFALTIYQLFFIVGTCLYCLFSFVLTGLLAWFISIPKTPLTRSSSPYFFALTGLVILAGPYLLNNNLKNALVGTIQGPQCEFSGNAIAKSQQAYNNLIQTGFKKGNNQSEIVVLELFAPTCPHCQSYYPTFKKTIEKYRDEVLFVYQPIPLSNQSLPLISALYAAAEQDAFFKLLDEIFAGGNENTGVSVYRLNQYLQNTGLNNKQTVSNINNGVYNNRIKAVSQNATRIGLNGVPSVLINGKVLADTEAIDECIQQAL